MPTNEEEENERGEEEFERGREKEPRKFLKRGSRQYLSSAKSRSKPLKNKEDNINKSRLD